jgi:hypothetical protein
MSDWQEHLARHATLVERYGKPEPVDAAEALRMTGKRSEVHPNDVAAFVHRSQESFEAFAASNRQHNGFETYGPLECGHGVLGIVDMRPALPIPTDPALPDPSRFYRSPAAAMTSPVAQPEREPNTARR